MQSTEVLESLSNIRGQVEAHLRNVKEYRAFLSIQAAMDEISHVGELHSPLESVREGVRQRLTDLREYRALLAVDKSMTDIAGVLGLLDEIAPRPAASAVAEPAPAEAIATEVAATDVAATEVAATQAAAAEVAAETQSEDQPAVAQTESSAPLAESSAPLFAEVAAVAAASEATPEPIEIVAASAPIEAEAATTEAQPTAETPAFAVSAAQAADIIVPAEMVADAPPAFETTPTTADEDVESLRVALGTDQILAPETPTDPLVVAESNPATEVSGIAPEQLQPEPQQTVPEHDPAIAKVA
jgi:hypothetical protein